MDQIIAYRNKTTDLLNEVNDISRELTNNINKINTLNEDFNVLFELFKRGSELSRILQDYFLSLEQDIKRLKEHYAEYKESLTEIGLFIAQANSMLESLRDSIDQIKTLSGLFIKSARLLANLAKNTEIKAHEAQNEGKGLAIIAQEALKLARLAQDPLQDLSERLANLHNIAQPAVEELNPMIELARSSPELINSCISVLALIDSSANTIQKMIKRIDQTNSMNNQLSNIINEEISQLTLQLSLTLNSIDNMSLHCSQICKLSDNLVGLDQMLKFLDSIENNIAEERNQLVIKKNIFISNFNFIRHENAQILNSFRIEKDPPIFSHEIHQNIRHVAAQTEELNRIGSELISNKEELGVRIDSVIQMSSKINDFLKETADIRNRLINVGNSLASELKQIEDQINATNRIFTRIKTLGLFVRIEESRSSQYRAVISPLVERFFILQADIEKAITGILPAVLQIHDIIAYFRHTKVNFPELKIKHPDYSRLKLFLDDIHRVFGEEIGQTKKINEFVGTIETEKKKLQKEWNDLSQLLANLQQMQGLFTDHETIPQSFDIIHHPDILRINIINDPVTFRPDRKTDITSTQIISCFSTGLFEFSDGVEVLPALCCNYTMSPDGRQYDFLLRPDIKYQNGKPVTIEDVKQGIVRALSGPNFNLFEMIEGSAEYIRTKNTKNLGIVPLNRTTLRIKLSYPFIPLISNFATNVADPFIDKELPICAGPYQLAEYDPGKKVVLRANQHYYQGKPPIDEVHFIIENDEEKCYELFRNREMHIYRPTSLTLKKIMKESPRSLQTIPELSIQYLCINCQKPPFDQILVRKALCHAINKTDMINTLLENESLLANGIFPPSIQTHNRRLTGYTYDPERARDLLEQAGFPDGLPDTYLLDISDNAPALLRAEYVKKNLARIGVRIEINPMPFSHLIEKSYEGRSILSFRGWISDNGDPDNFIYPLFHSRSYGHTGNTFFFSTPELDKDIDNARRIHNLIQRNMLYQKIESAIVEAAPAVFLYHRLLSLAVNEKIRLFKPHPLNIYNLRSTWTGAQIKAPKKVLSRA